ncbi:DUF5344 family protein [Pseudoflavonifractor sp. An187]|uniref:DUF5344 family protein n=1 Tax=Pseudoflavonifractor sp. An187 TaxID=1965578 RepID=UPI000B371ED7|nr:DUF5344 family protein [Pseudoflavonifractor sp. An187]OUP41487.1 hypothetical protein B5F22_10095 [Pseudoflavonifractor sp. An187]
MDEIKISVSGLQDSIAQLRKLKDDWEANDVSVPATIGGGRTVNEMELLAQLYKKLNFHMVSLAENTIAFLTNVKNSYEESDNKAAKKINQ